MPGARNDEARRSVVPSAAGRSLWLAAVWTGAGAAVLCATVSIIVVAICWLPVSGADGRAHSAIHAGLLSFLAALHGGATVDGMSGTFLPLGMMIAVGLTAWRAGVGLADAADQLDERDPLRLAVAAATQAGSFTLVCLLFVPFSSLGTSSAPFAGVGIAALLLFTVVGGGALALYSPLSDRCMATLGAVTARVARAVVAVVSVYAGAGALLVAGSLVVHHANVEMLSGQVGGGWGGLPILLLGVLAAPNAVIAGIAYLAGPGFAIGSGTTVSAFTAAHGTMPAFPVLGAVPNGRGANAPTWALMAVTALAAGVVLARLARRETGRFARLRFVGCSALGVLACMSVLGWQGGGSIGDGRLRAVGASPWQLGLSVAVVSGALACAVLALDAVRESMRAGSSREPFGVAAAKAAKAAKTAKAAKAARAVTGTGGASALEAATTRTAATVVTAVEAAKAEEAQAEGDGGRRTWRNPVSAPPHAGPRDAEQGDELAG